MVVQSSGQLTFTDIQTEFGGENPISMSEYFQNSPSGYASNVAGVPSTGSQMTLSVFYGKAKAPVTTSSASLPAYYTSTSMYHMANVYRATTIALKFSSNIATADVIRTYSPLTSGSWNTVHDKDLDSNVYYGMPETGSPKTLYKYTLQKGGTAVTTVSLGTYSGATSSVLGSCYAPACMGAPYGAYLIGGYQQSVIHVLELNATKTAIAYTYTVSYLNEVYGVEVIPSQASGFTQHFAVAYTRSLKYMSSWTVDMAARTWSNVYTINYTSGVTGPSNGLGLLYYPIGKPIYGGDTETTTNRIAMTDTSTAKLYVWVITQNGNQLAFTFSRTITTSANGTTPYSLSVNAYNSIS